LEPPFLPRMLPPLLLHRRRLSQNVRQFAHPILATPQHCVRHQTIPLIFASPTFFLG
jgi:hypothetical protein